MGDIENKLGYLNETKQLIREAIEDKGVHITDSDDFRSYEGAIRNISAHGGVEIGDIFQSPMGIDETLNTRRYLNGQIIQQADFPAFTAKLKRRIVQYPNIACTETEWQSYASKSTLNQCGKFVVDNTNGTIRLPRIIKLDGIEGTVRMGDELPIDQSMRRLVAKREPTASDKRWYNWYSDGWIEQGGQYLNSGTNAAWTSQTQTFLLPFRDTMYTIQTMTGHTSNSDSPCINAKTTTNFTSQPYNSTGNANWTAQGYGAKPTIANYQTTTDASVRYPYYIQVALEYEENVHVTSNITLQTPFMLFESKHCDNEIQNPCWLRSLGQWNSAEVYQYQYEYLVSQHATPTRGGISVKLSTESYTDTDFVVNTADRTFRLPLKTRERFVVKQWGNDLTGGVLYSDGYLEQYGQTASGSNVTHTVTLTEPYKSSDAYTITGMTTNDTNYAYADKYLSANSLTANSFQLKQRYNSSNTAVVNRWRTFGFTNIPTTNKFLYFFVGDATREIVPIQQDRMLDALAKKVDVTSIACYPIACGQGAHPQGVCGWMVYNNGYCRQWGILTTPNASYVDTWITLKIPYKSMQDYVISALSNNSGDLSYAGIESKEASRFMINQIYNLSGYANWQTEGFIDVSILPSLDLPNSVSQTLDVTSLLSRIEALEAQVNGGSSEDSESTEESEG